MATPSETKALLLRAHDLELAALAATGERAAFGELVRRHNGPVRGLLRRMGAAAALADDIAQDAFLVAFEQVAEFRGQGTFQAWVKKIAARLYVRRFKRDARLDMLDEGDGAGAGGEEPAIGRIDLDAALKALSPAERMCVSLCYGAGLSHNEAAEVLNTPLGTVKSHVKRGLDKLRARLAPGQQAEQQHG